MPYTRRLFCLVNRTFRDEPGGLVVDYISIAESLQAALADYTDRARQEVGAPTAEALDLLQEKHEVLNDLLDSCPWREALGSGSDKARVEAIMGVLERLLGAADLELPDRFIHHTRIAGQAFAIAVTAPEALTYRDDLAFFQAVAVELRRARSADRAGPTVFRSCRVVLARLLWRYGARVSDPKSGSPDQVAVAVLGGLNSVLAKRQPSMLMRPDTSRRTGAGLGCSSLASSAVHQVAHNPPGTTVRVCELAPG
jgi:hypothetical protein